MIQFDPDWKLPWWCGGAIEWVDSFLAAMEKPQVFEYGSGMSSRWLAERCDTLVTVDNNAVWYERVRLMLDSFPRATPLLRKDLHYVNSIQQNKKPLDLVIIDGVERPSTLKVSIPKVRAGGAILVDDAQASVYWSMQRLLVEWHRFSFPQTSGDKQHAGKVTCVYVKP